MALVAVLFLACRGGDRERDRPGPLQAKRMEATIGILLDTLNLHPGALPPAPDPDRPVVMVVFERERGQPVQPRGPFPVHQGSLTYERLRASHLRGMPDYWVVMTDAEGGRALYWAPIVGADTVLVETPGVEKDEPLSVEMASIPGRPVTVRLPYFPGALVALYPARGPGDSPGPGEILVMGELARPVPGEEGGVSP